MRRFLAMMYLRNDKKQDYLYHLYLSFCIFAVNNVIMRRLFIFIMGPLIVACSPISNYHHQLEQVESVIEDNPDSAKILLEKIPSPLLSQEGERALYYLLLTMADYKLYKHFSNDSSIKFSVSYYKKTNQTMRLATAYYYMGAINYEELNQKKLAVHYLKKAEDLSNVCNNELLKNKIFELFHSINYNAQNFKLSLQYANLFLESSKKIGDPELISRAYEHLSNDYISLGDDKAANYIEQSLKYADLCSDKRRSYVYGNYANLLLGEKRYKEAFLFLEKAVRLHRRWQQGEKTSTNPIATIFAWTGALRRRGELDGNEALVRFSAGLEKACLDTIEAGAMTKDLAALCGDPDVRPLNTSDFLQEIRSRLEAGQSA